MPEVLPVVHGHLDARMKCITINHSPGLWGGLPMSFVTAEYEPGASELALEAWERQREGVRAVVSGKLVTVRVGGEWQLWVEVTNVKTRTTRGVPRHRHG